MIEQRVTEILVNRMRQLRPEQIVPQAELIRDLGADSLDITEIVFELEYTFDLEIDDGDAADIKTVGDIYRYIKLRMSKS